MNSITHSTSQMLSDIQIIQEKVYIIQPILDKEDYKTEHAEAMSLIESAGAVYAGTIYQAIREIVPATYIGSGKLAALRERLEGLSEITVLFNGDLSPSQTLNISAALNDVKVIDRTTLILDIFAKRAQSNEGKLQVELAQLKYIYPRLKGKGAALSKLGGGIGTRGPGETQLETDRRHIRMRIDFLEDKLRALATRRSLINDRREKDSVKTISLIGYTNTGKSTLLNALTNADVYAADQLFATLDLTTRRLQIDGSDFLLTDTVGFLQSLPHNLIEAFKSTLESALRCDLALIVCDAAGAYNRQLETTLQTLKEMHFEKPYLIVMNKSENIDDFTLYPRESIFISAKTGMGLDRLREKILEFFRARTSEVLLRIPYEKMSLYGKMKKYVVEKDFSYRDDALYVKAVIENIYLDKFKDYFCG